MTASPQQRKLYGFLEDRESSGLPSPSLREICGAMGFRSTNAASDLVRKLEESGAIIRDPRCARSIRLVCKSTKGIPLLGAIPAGFPDSATTPADETVEIDPQAFGIRSFGDAFALRVRGDSMIGRNLLDGDLVLFDRSARPGNGDIVAALIDRETTLKTLILKHGKAWLKAENPAYPDLVPVTDLMIQGVAKAVIRHLAA